MLEVLLGSGYSSTCRVLCLGAHCDDIEIGCGGTVLRLIHDHKNLEFCWVVFGSDGDRSREATESAAAFLAGAMGRRVIIMDFRDGYFPYIGSQIKENFEGLKQAFSPDLIFTHYRNDLHQDHRLVSNLPQFFRSSERVHLSSEDRVDSSCFPVAERKALVH